MPLGEDLPCVDPVWGVSPTLSPVLSTVPQGAITRTKNPRAESEQHGQLLVEQAFGWGTASEAGPPPLFQAYLHGHSSCL